MAQSVIELAEKVRRGAISALTLVSDALERADQQKDINAFITLDRQGALADAHRIDKEIKSSGNPGRLAGVPLVIKDNINVEGLKTTAGTPGIDFIAENSAPIVARLKAEGAVIIGKTNMHELAFGVTSNNATFGTVRNPTDPSRIPGGSSGGTAAAIAAGIAPGGVGTDTAGSVRVPAALTGICGLRPTTWRVDQTGIVPSVPTFDVAGPMANSIDDLSLLNAVMTGAPVPLPRALPGLRLGVPTAYRDTVSPGVSAAFDHALLTVEQAGTTLIPIDISLISGPSFEVGFAVGFHEMKTAMTAFLNRHQPRTSLEDLVEKIAGKDVRDTYINAVLGAGAPTESDYQAAKSRIRTIRKDYLDLFDANALDALVFPTTALEAPPIAGSDETVTLNGETIPTLAAFMRNVAATGVYGAPGLSMPIALADKKALPVGLELDGRPDGDLDLLAIGLSVEEELRRHPSN